LSIPKTVRSALDGHRNEGDHGVCSRKTYMDNKLGIQGLLYGAWALLKVANGINGVCNKGRVEQNSLIIYNRTAIGTQGSFSDALVLLKRRLRQSGTDAPCLLCLLVYYLGATHDYLKIFCVVESQGVACS